MFYSIVLHAKTFVCDCNFMTSVCPFRYFIVHQIPKLKFLDSTPVKTCEKTEAQRIGGFMRVARPKIEMAVSLPFFFVRRLLIPEIKLLSFISKFPKYCNPFQLETNPKNANIKHSRIIIKNIYVEVTNQSE